MLYGKLHDIATEIYEITSFNNIELQELQGQWISRDKNDIADAISKMIDVDDWQISYDFF